MHVTKGHVLKIPLIVRLVYLRIRALFFCKNMDVFEGLNTKMSFRTKAYVPKAKEKRMSLSRKLLESMGLEADKVSTIIEAHAETVDSLKNQIADFKGKAEKYESTQAELDKIKSEFESIKTSGGDWQKKYDQISQEFESYKADQIAKDLKIQKDGAYRKLLKETGISEKRIDSIMKLTDLDSIELEDGKIKDSVKAVEGIKAEWADFITETSVQTPNTQTPPKNDSLKKYSHEEISKMTPDEINANWDSIKESMKN